MARSGFQPKISHARFVVGPFSSQQMGALGSILGDTIRNRIQHGLNVYDQPAKPLSAAYAKAKQKRGRNPIRDWTNSGNTMRALGLLSANENRAVVGFNNPVAARVAHFNNLRERDFGVSPNDRRVIAAAVSATARESSVITVRKAS